MTATTLPRRSCKHARNRNPRIIEISKPKIGGTIPLKSFK